MKLTFIISLILFSFGCRHTMNGTGVFEKNNLSENNLQKLYVTIPHDDGQSVLRRKLLNQKLTEIMKKNGETTIEKGDEFEFTNGVFEGLNKSEYENMAASSAEIIVSYNDRLEIYFVSPGATQRQIMHDLNLMEEDGGKFSWYPKESEVKKGKKYFLLNASLEEVKLNDQNFYSEKMDASNFTNKNLKFTDNQKIILHLNIDAQFPETTNSVVVFRNQVGPMTTECSYVIEKLTGTYTAGDWQKSGAEIFINIDGLEIPLKDFATTFENGSFKIIIDLNKFTKNKTANVTLSPLKIPQKIRQVSGYNYGPFCVNKNANAALDVTPKIELNLKAEVQGRALNF